MAQDRSLGVADCANSTCHGATKPFANLQIRQDEYFIWQRKDRHARAYTTLLSERSKAMTARLGWKAPEEEPRCLNCHAGAPKPELRGARFLIDDGVGCEVCHGPAERWIGPHVKGLKTAAEKTALGMTPTWDVQARAQLCTGCHLGDRDHPMTHQIMAAGHPPLQFELDTFIALMPPHHDIDRDYIERKGAVDPALQWLVGQLAAADAYLEGLERGAYRGGLFPELAWFDCDACHHPMDAGRDRPGRTPGLPAGTVPLADQSLVMLAAWLGSADAGLEARWRDGLVALYAGYRNGDLSSAARAQRVLLRDRLRPLADRTATPKQIRATLRAVIASAQGAHGGDFRHAEQVAMASTVLSAALAHRGESVDELQRAAMALYASVDDRDRFQTAGYAAALTRVASALGP